MALEDFLQKGAPQKIGTTGSIGSFINRKTGQNLFLSDTTTSRNSTPEALIEDEKSTLSDAFRVVGKELMKPSGILGKQFRGVGGAIGNLLAIASPKVTMQEGAKKAANELLQAQKESWNVLLGTEESSYTKEVIDSIRESGREPDALDKTFAIAGDFVLDPLNKLKPIKALSKAGDVTGAKKGAKFLESYLKELPTSKRIRSLFSNTTGNKEFDDVLKKFRNLRTAREASLIEDAVSIQKTIKKIGGDAEAIITEGLENPASLKNVTDERILNIVDNLKRTYKNLLGESKKVGLKVGEIMDYAPHIRTKDSFGKKIRDVLGATEFGTAGVEKGRTLEGTIKELTEKGIDIFEQNPAIQLAKKGQAYAKAITSKQFADEIAKFATDDGIEVSNKLLSGKKFPTEFATVIDNFYSGIKPEEINIAIKSFDKIQNLWKAQALISPSYHIRNTVGNLWNNFLAGVNPWAYGRATLIQKGILKDERLLKEMTDLGVIDQGWYAKDIGEEVLNRVDGIGNWKKSLNPVSQQNALFKLNRNIGSAVENNARIAHYLSKRADGLSPERAAESVKRYLFDYGDLTDFERNILKRAVPFYTWTRKNLPLQISELVVKPEKFVIPTKIVELLESGVEVPNEKYMSPYITENIPVRIRKNEEGDTEYFLLGNWLPYASALDVLSSPLQTLFSMSSPLVKAPLEYISNKSTFFRDTFGEPQEIERTYKEQGEFVGQLMRKKNINLLRNIRVLNDINKLIDKNDPTATKDSPWVKMMNILFGKAATYDVNKSKYFYDQDTEDRIRDLKRAIKSAEKKGFSDKANELRQELRDTIELRKGE